MLPLASIYKNLVRDSSTSGGTGALLLAGAPRGYQPASTLGSDGAMFSIREVDSNGIPTGKYEVSYCNYVSGSLVRAVVEESSAEDLGFENFTRGAVKTIELVESAAQVRGKSTAYPPFTLTPTFVADSVFDRLTLSGDLEIVPDTTGAIPFKQAIYSFIGNGTNSVTVGGGALPFGTNTGFDVTTGVETTLVVWPNAARDRVYYSFLQDENAVPLPSAAPNAPTVGVLSPGNNSVSLAFTPSGSGGLASGFLVTLSNGNQAGGPSSPIAVGTPNGVAVTAIVKAINGIGVSGNSATSNSATPSVGAASITGTFSNTGTIGSAYSSSISTSGFVGTITPIVASGSLPAGLTLGVSGTNITLTGTPTTGASSSFTVSATGSTSPTSAVTSPAQAITVAASGGGATPVDLTTVSGITKSGSPNFLYTGNSGGGDVTNQIGVGAVASTIGAACTLQADITDVTNGDFIIGVDPSASNVSFASAAWAAQQHHADLITYSGGTTIDTVTGAFANGNKMRMRTATTTVVIEKSTDGGTTWSAISTFTGVTPQTSALHPHGYINGTNTITGLKGTGLA